MKELFKIGKALFITGLFFYSAIALANDGAFYASGNQLIPIRETTISIQKEILRIVKVGDELDVTVDYTFFNPGQAKSILVGFEAASPSGDVDGTPKNGKHPYMNGFSAELNGIPLRFKTAIVRDTSDYLNDEVHSISIDQAMGNDFNVNAPDFYYVYYFNASFKKGVNRLIHHYRFQLSSSVMEHYSFQYILTAANRWANNGIDDFTLELDLGSWTSFDLAKTFFEDNNKWKVDGVLRNVSDKDNWLELYKNGVRAFVRAGKLTYHQKNFHPKGELYLGKLMDYSLMQIESFNAQEHRLPFDFRDLMHLHKAKDEKSYKILRNLPYARRGYIFKTAYIQEYYEQQPWYEANAAYEAKQTDLLLEEKEWLDKVNEVNR